MNVGAGKRDPDDRFGDMSEFGRRALQEFAPRRDVKENIARFDRRSDRATAGDDFVENAAVAPNLRARLRVRRSTAQDELTDFGDRRERFAPKTERVNAEKVVRFGNFARRVRRQRQNELFRRDSATVVDDFD